jgi:hypothetical protein
MQISPKPQHRSLLLTSSPPSTAPPPSPRLRKDRRPLSPWIIAWLLAALYTALWLWWIHRNTALPFFDQANYVWKVYSIAEKWHHAPHWWSRLNPNFYLDTELALRPPLLIIPPALLVGGKISVQSIAVWWLLSRVLILMLGLWTLARAVGTAAWVPIATAAFLATRPLLLPQPSLYMMDLPFESFAVLLFGCAAITLRNRAAWPAWAFEASALALFLVKSQGLIFLLPFAACIALERAPYEWRLWRSHPVEGETGGGRWKRQLRPLLFWCIPHLLAILIVYGLLHSVYGQAITDQFALGSRGYWTSPVSWQNIVDVTFSTMPPWILLLAALSLVLSLWNRLNPTRRLPPLRKGILPILLMAFLAFAAWLFFNLRIAYTFDARVVFSIQGVMIAALALLAARGPLLTRVSYVFAFLIFALSLSVAAAGFPVPTLNAAGLLGSPVVHQHPAEEVGLTPFMAQLEPYLKAHTAPHELVGIYVLVNDEFIDAPAFAFAGRELHRGRWPNIAFRSVDMGTGTLDFPATFAAYSYFITKSPNFTVPLAGDAAGNITAFNSLITDPASPLHPLLEPVLTQPLHAPALYYADPQTFHDDTLTLWHLKRPLTPSEITAALAFIRNK